MSGGWWQDAVIYQVYLRSFRDGDGDGVGDIRGLRDGLDHVADLGVDAIWVNPWYPSPQADGGYDVADHRDVADVHGTLADADALVDEAHDRGLRVLLDLVPNHTSREHPWFREALAGGPDSPARDRYVFREGRGEDGRQPPTNWTSSFGGPAWTRIVEPDDTPGPWYLHLFSSDQPDLQWHHPDVVADFDETLRFWFDRGVDGFRVDVAHALFKDSDFPDLPDDPGDEPTHAPGTHPHWDRDEVHAVYRRWRRLADAHEPPRVFVAEAVTPDADRRARYVRPDELHGAFAFDLLESPWSAPDLRQAIDHTLGAHAGVGAPPTWVLSNHDVVRHLSRYARDQDRVTGHNLADLVHLPADLERGTARARAAVLLLLGLPGSVALYQGEELGLPEVEDLPEEAMVDPVWQRSGGTDPGRDGCRVPLPWDGEAPPFGFSTRDDVSPPQPRAWKDLTVAAQGGPGSMLWLYRRALEIRRTHPALGVGSMTWTPAGADLLAFQREPGLACWVNLGATPVDLPPGMVLLASTAAGRDRRLAPDAAAWIDTGSSRQPMPGSG